MNRLIPRQGLISARAKLACFAVMLVAGMSLPAQEPPAETPSEQDSQEAQASEGFQVVINAQNPTTELPANRIARIFLKKLKRWDNGVRVQPVDLEVNSATREAFTRNVHGKSVTAIKSYWQRMIFSGRDVPPEERKTEREVLEFVRAHPGAIGYVAADTPLGDGVKKLDVTS